MPDEKKKPSGKVPRTFLTPAFLVEVEPKLFGLYRSITVEGFDRQKGKTVREKVKDIGPIGLFRECEGQEQPDLKTFHPTEHRPMRLKKVDG